MPMELSGQGETGPLGLRNVVPISWVAYICSIGLRAGASLRPGTFGIPP